MKIPLLDLVAQYHSIQTEIDAAVHETLESGYFILGEAVRTLEEEVSAYLGVRYAVGVASGTDALVLALRALEIGPGSEVIVPAYTFFATVGAVLQTGARPVMVDVHPDTYCIDMEQAAARLTPATRAILPVHLYGHPADMEAASALAGSHGLRVIEDNAQAFGATYQGHKTGATGDISCLSFFPSKNLGAYGDGGMVTTGDPALAEKVRMLRTHGWKKKYYPEVLGYNSRLDALQAAILRAKLPHLDGWNERRRELAAQYTRRLSGLAGITPPCEAPGARHVYHLYVVRTPERDALQARLKEAGIESAVYYPVPPHLTPMGRELGYGDGDFPVAEQASRETLAIPIYPEMSEEQVAYLLSILSEWMA